MPVRIFSSLQVDIYLFVRGSLHRVHELEMIDRWRFIVTVIVNELPVVVGANMIGGGKTTRPLMLSAARENTGLGINERSESMSYRNQFRFG